MNDRDILYIVNKYDSLTIFHWKSKKLSFPRYLPVAIDYTDDPELVRALMEFPQLTVCPKKKAREILESKKEKLVEGVQSESEVETLLEKGKKDEVAT